MREPTDAQLGQTVRKFADYLANELGWLSNGEFDLERLYLAADRLDARSSTEWKVFHDDDHE